MRVTVLASGSSGNATLLECGATRVLIDAGLMPRELSRRLEHARRRLEDVQAVFVTHEHSDHAVGAAALASAGIAVHATAGTAQALGLDYAQHLTPGVPTRLGALEITAVPLPHDAAEPVAYRISDGDGCVGILTDCGHAAPDVAAAFAGCDLLVLETNHDRRMLATGPYPAGLRQRIAGDRGHLSNEQSAALLEQMGPGGIPVALVLAHLSRKNNRPELAHAAISEVLVRHARPARVLIASQKQPGPTMVVSRGRVDVETDTGRQLQLPLPEPGVAARVEAAR